MDTFDLPVLPSTRPTCDGCVAHCCRYVSVEIDRPEAKWQHDQIRWMLVHENISVYVNPDGDWFVEFKTRCGELGEDNLCRSYERRPDLCRRYEPDACPVWSTEPAHRHEFHTADEYTAWLDSRNIDWRFRAHEPQAAAPGRRATARESA
ncbi:MAG: YkgJ family cysteine cluster protein [Candidatus Eisenbacteria bacterium]|nr:YkgJ family cysteine cluster protein [Candidatus Eisenbacteria bacterium]